ncbi:hypothetical protein QU481_09170 [Crenobacter sp. SG2303]|uniref:Cytochrome c domain-containing protein n=1 Tax=Crenobacter oryzisoli TaxID=3056844 RepID=A0ABT7XMW3_9NEIS|nr:hypothetical protein [Crenobacter sp. SG2303]MDN0075065.1 hypothetical protein [Crenobacter sp. SG2303]
MHLQPDSGNHESQHRIRTARRSLVMVGFLAIAFATMSQSAPSMLAVSATSAASPALGASVPGYADLQMLNQAREAYPAASIAPRPVSGGRFESEAETGAPTDEAAGGHTMLGVKLNRRKEQCFPTETRNLFSEVDKVIVGNDPAPRPMDYSNGEVVPPEARNAIKGQNTWMLWGEGNEAFWDWVQQNGYGIADFLILLDSRKRDTRFADAGLMNQPGMIKRDQPLRGLGIYIDQGDGDKVKMTAPKGDINSETHKLEELVKAPANHTGKQYREFFEIGDEGLYKQTITQLANDGVDPRVYGYPSGIVGLRLMLNPDFFGKSKAAEEARRYWQEQVVKDNGARYYSRTEDSIHADPKLVRPFRVSMACSFCHVGPHPLAPPQDLNHPAWGNMSSTIGNQYWTPSQIFSNIKREDSFLWQFVASQQPGTIDTSLVATDHINNPNTINAIFEINARLARADLNPPEHQSDVNMLLRGIEDAPLFNLNPRHTPRVLLDGADSIGVEGALLRVYLNIGAYSEQWRRVQNTIIGFTPQRPFDLPTIRAKSIYWDTTEHYRVSELESFFTYVSKTGANVTQPMKLESTADGRQRIERDRADIRPGREVFLQHCAVCHSSKQPPGQQLTFSRSWRTAPGGPEKLTLPMDFADWEAFKRSGPYLAYVERLLDYMKLEAKQGHDLFQDNYLSTDIRVPITLVGTNSQRAVATNAMRGQVWDNFSSDTYKSLPAVGLVHFFNPFKSDRGVDEWGNNDAYAPPAGGPGYYRPASLVSLWATAPLLHNNALGIYNHNPSVKRRLDAFDDAIDKLLTNNKRANGSGISGDFRQKFADAGVAGKLGFRDVGFIYRTTADSYLDFRRPFIRPLLNGVLGETTTSFLSLYLWLTLAAIALLLVFVGRGRLAGSLLALLAIIVAALLRGSGVDTIYPWLWIIPALALIGGGLFFLRPDARDAMRWFFGTGALAFLIIGGFARAFVDGEVSDIRFGPIPKGTPVNLIMNINPEAPTLDLFNAASGLLRGILRVRKDNLTDETHHPPFAALAAFQEEAGPALLKASKCPDFVLDRGHWFGEALSGEQKRQLKAFLETF